MINKDTKLCMSLAARPSNFGTFFHNYLYKKLKLNYIYKAFTTNNLRDAIYGVKALGIRGCAISMPYKEECIQYMDELDISASAIQSVNTIVNNDGYLKAYNTDFIAVENLLKESSIPTDILFVLYGTGGMAKAVLGALYESRFKNGYVMGRNIDKAETLASIYGYNHCSNRDTVPEAKLLINVTPIGMAGGVESEDLAFDKDAIERADTIFDVVALPVETPLIKEAIRQNKKIISGADVAVIQALEQFVLYTGVRPSVELVKEASDFARQKIKAIG
ncbi:shikimate 5-dehydrogenase [Dysgonomonas massiliensis]|uniref:shikimate 5-dehydrogenase n=1 Tax=Dysgonomonas massiliensis TaxID=2040292 RepID=UPI000C774751|nr:shikimate 5-dehydrogenase [Dysgonomonas massiliensis]